MRERQLEKRLQILDVSQVRRFLEGVKAQVCLALSAPLDDFLALYLARPVAVGAAQSKRSTFQTADGRLVVSVVDKGTSQPGGPHLVELGIRTHEPKWIGGWAFYRLCDARGNLAVAGVVKIDKHGSSIQTTVPPTEHAPYTVQVEMLELETSQLEQVLSTLTAGGEACQTP